MKRKKKIISNIIIIDGTYNNIRYTLTGVTSTEAADMIMASSLNKEIVVRNINIIFLIHIVIYVPLDTNYAGILTSYDSINFNCL